MNTKKLIPCVQCGNQISSEAKTCPSCRHKQGDPQKKIMCYCCDKEIKFPEGVTLEKKGVVHRECKQIISEYSSIYSLDSREGKSNRLYKHEFSCSLCEHDHVLLDQAHRVHTECKKCGHPKTSKLPQRSYDKHCIHCGFMLNEFADDNMVLQRLSLGTFIHVICCPPHLKNQREEAWLKNKELKEGIKDPNLSMLSPAQVQNLRGFTDKSTLLIKKTYRLKSLTYIYNSDADNSEYDNLFSSCKCLTPEIEKLLDGLFSNFLSMPYVTNDKKIIRDLQYSRLDDIHTILRGSPENILEQYYRRKLHCISFRKLTDIQKLQLEQIDEKICKIRNWSVSGKKKSQSKKASINTTEKSNQPTQGGLIMLGILILAMFSLLVYGSQQKQKSEETIIEKVERENARRSEIRTSILINGGPVNIQNLEKVNEILGMNFPV